MTKGDLLRVFLEDRGVRLPLRSGWAKVSCFGAGHTRGDRNPSLSVNLTTGYCRCWSCDVTDGRTVDVYELYMREHGVTFTEAKSALGASDEDTGPEEIWL